jgi:hypothetical protein
LIELSLTASGFNYKPNKSKFSKKRRDLTYEGEIVDYRISPMTATADQQASQNRLKIRVNISNKK